MAPASPWRVPREVKEFMAAPAVELAVDAATERKKKSKAKLRQLTLFILFDHRAAYNHTQEHNRATCKEKEKRK